MAKKQLPHQDKTGDELREIIASQGKRIRTLMKVKKELKYRVGELEDENNTCRLQLKSPEKSIIWYRVQPEDRDDY
jgi:hypothetical protein